MNDFVIRSVLQPGRMDPWLVVVLDSLPEYMTGDEVEVVVGRKSFGFYAIREFHETSLGELTEDDIEAFVYPSVQVFWQRYEKALGTGLPAETKIWLVTLGPEYADDSDNDDSRLDFDSDEYE